MTVIYEKLFLVRNIHYISGLQQVQDIILSYAYKNDYYMEKAKEFSQKFNIINSVFKYAITRNNWPKYDFSSNNVNITFNIGCLNDDGECWQFAIPVAFIDNPELQNKPYTTNQFLDEAIKQIVNGVNCPHCGEYMVHSNTTNLPVCNCDIHNDFALSFENILDDWDDFYTIDSFS